MSPLDLFTLYADVALMASGRNVVEMVGAAQPPDSNRSWAPLRTSPSFLLITLARTGGDSVLR